MYYLNQDDKNFMTMVKSNNYHTISTLDRVRHTALSIAEIDIMIAQLDWEECRAIELDDIDNAASCYETGWELYLDTSGDRAHFKHHEPDMAHDEWLRLYAVLNVVIPRICD